MNRYVKVIAPKDYPGKVYGKARQCYEHQLIWWQNTNELVSTNELIHHKDENKSNNDFINLEKKTKSLHSSEHNRERSPLKFIELTCKNCSVVFSKELYKHKYQAKVGTVNFFCSQRCKGIYQQKQNKLVVLSNGYDTTLSK